MAIKLVKVDPQYTYRWPDGSIETYKAVVYNVQSREVSIGFTQKKAYGTMRGRVVVFVDGYPEAEFCGADDYDITGRLVAVIKRPDGKYMDMNELNEEYVGLPIFDHSTIITKGFKGKVGLVATEYDHDLMIRHALIQSKWRRAR